MEYSKASLYFALFICFFSSSVIAEETPTWTKIKNDYNEFYTAERFTRIGLVFAGGAVLANTKLDQNFQDHFQNKIRSSSTDNTAKTAKLLGEGKYLIPLSIISASVNHYLSNGAPLTGVGKWGQRTARAYLVGGPTVLTTQLLTGASRPSENKKVSTWKPFNDSNGVSGHAFIGSVPFLTIAHMNNDNAFIKYGAYFASTLAGISRINDNQHYLSQVMLGWYLGWESVDAVYTVDSPKKNDLVVRPLVGNDSYGVQLSMHW
jgi:hypothetical protein